MVIWALYGVAVSALLGLAALCAERAARLRRGATRWYWLAAILASILVPTIIASVSVQAPAIIGAASQRILVLRDATSIPLSPQQWIRASNAQVREWRSLDAVLRGAWMLCSAAMLLVLLAHAAWLRSRRRHWRQGAILDRPVLLTADVGPAVVGFVRPAIVVPEWVVQAPRQTQLAIVAHEHGHLEAGDPQLFTIALFLLVAIPWNLPLWWQLRRLRHAIEVDCDARVIRGGQDVLAYSESLISAGARRSAYVGAVAAMSESPSLLEQRIKIMLGKPTRWWKVSAAALVCLSMVFVGAAAQVSPPNAQSSAPARIQLDAATLDHYVGHYKVTDNVVMAITRNGTQLSTQLTGQPAFDIYPTSLTHFVVALEQLHANFDALTDPDGRATAMVLHQNGQDITMPRIDDAAAAQVNAELAARVQSNTPQPGSEAAVRDYFTRVTHGQPPDYSKMGPMLAKAAREQSSQISQLIGALGALQSITLQGVSTMGYDSYLVRLEKGSLAVKITLDGQGIIQGMLVQPYP